MSTYSDDFTQCARKMSNKFTRVDSAVLCYTTTTTCDLAHYYDFVTRTMLLRVQSKEGTHLVHFRDIEPDTLAFMRDKLIELGGTPPALPVPPADNKVPSPIRKAT